MDKYKNYNALRRNQTRGEDYRIHLYQRDSGVAVIAPHGGCIEPGTTEIACAVAGREHSFYTFEGIKINNNSDLHITSKNFDEPRAVDLVQKSRIVLCIHGCVGDEEAVYVGGLDHHFVTCVRGRLLGAGFSATGNPSPGMQGIGLINICNRGQTNKGVQLEFTGALRKKMFINLKRNCRMNTTDTFHKLVAVLREVLSCSSSKQVNR